MLSLLRWLPSISRNPGAVWYAKARRVGRRAWGVDRANADEHGAGQRPSVVVGAEVFGAEAPRFALIL
jgi:hypothetical protein